MSRSFSYLCALFFLALLAACNREVPQAEPSATLQEPERPDLSALHEYIAAGLRNQRRKLDLKIKSPDSPPEELAAAYGQMGMAYHAHNFHEAARVCYLDAQLLDGDNNRWPYYLGFIYQKQGAPDKAEAAWKRVLEKSSFDFLTNVRLGNLLIEQQRWDEASACFEKAFKVNPNEAMVFYGQARIAAGQSDDARAAELFQRTLQMQPAATTVNYPLGLAFRNLGENEKAERFIRRRGDGPVTIADPSMEKLLAIVTDAMFDNTLAMAADHDHFDHKAFFSYVRSNLRGKREFVDRLAAYAEEKVQTAADERELARIHFAVADLLDFFGDKEAALKHLAYGARLDSTYDELYLALARMTTELGRYDGTLQLLGSYLKAFPGHVEASMIKASALIGKGDKASMKEAFAVLDEILAADPKQYPARVLRSRALFQQGKRKQAAAEYEEVLLAEMPDQEKSTHLATYAHLVEENGDAEGALNLLERSLQYDPDSVPARYDLAGLLARMKRYDEANAAYAQVISAQPKHEGARISQAASAIMGKHYRRAIEALEDGCAAIPGSLELTHLLARILAICPDDSLRDGARARALASAVYQRDQSALHAETYAMALAQAGDFDKATTLQDALLESARKQGIAGAIKELRGNLRRYQKQQTCCADYSPATILGKAAP